MVATTLDSLTIPTAVTGNQPAIKADRFGLGLVAKEPPADFLSQGQFSLPRLSTPDQPGGRKDKGEPDMRYPEPSQAPASSVGSISGAPVCPSVLPTHPSHRSPKELWRTDDTAEAADLESKLDPFPRSRDCQSPLRGQVHQRDIPTTRTGVKPAKWSQVAGPAATHAAK